MTTTWALVSAIAVSALLLFAIVFRPFRFISRRADGSEAKPSASTSLLAAAAPIVAAVIVGLFGTLVAQRVIDSEQERAARDSRQVAVRDKAHARTEQVQLRLDTIARFLPQFSKTEQEKSAAILAIRATGDLELAATLAGLFPSSGSVTALEIIAIHSSPDERGPAVTALGAMNTSQSIAALTKVFDDASHALVAFDCEAPDGGHTPTVIAGVVWSERWLFAPLGNLANARPRGILHTEERGRQPSGDGLTRIHVEEQPRPVPLVSIQFSSTPPDRGEPVFAIGLDSAGRPSEPRLGVVAEVGSDALLARFPGELAQVTGSLLVLPSGLAVGMLSHDQHQTGSYRYIRGDDIAGWFVQLEREEHERQRRR